MALPANIVKKLIPGKQYPETARVLAEKWGPVFGVSPGWVVSHAFVESTNKPLAYNERGNAWGLMQIKPGTASDIVRWMKGSDISKDPRVAEVLKATWKGSGEDLLHPELNVMLGTFYLGYIKKKFDTEDHKIVASAYNQGPGAAAKALRNRQLTPEMKIYVAKIEEAKEKGYT